MKHILFLGLVALIATPGLSSDKAKAHYKTFDLSLDVEAFVQGYPAIIKKLLSDNTDDVLVALDTISTSEEINAIPLLVPFITEDHASPARVHASAALERLVQYNELKRRDPERDDIVALLPRKKGDIDLRPVGWVAKKMLAHDDTESYGASIIGYLQLNEYEPDLRKLLKSKHPATTRAAVHALGQIGITISPGPHPIIPESSVKFITDGIPFKAENSTK